MINVVVIGYKDMQKIPKQAYFAMGFYDYWLFCLPVTLFFHSYEFLFLTLAAGAAPCVGQLLERRAGRDVLLGVALFWVVGVLAGAFELCHNGICFKG
jgi:hypothetical protein